MLLQSPSLSLPTDPTSAVASLSPPPSPPHAADLFTDVFSASPSPPLNDIENSHTAAETSTTSSLAEPSDIPRLRSTHVTAGYREGIAAGKGSSLQGGFDEAYPLGAAMGLRIGQILGVLEGLSKAVETALGRAKASNRDKDAEESVEIVALAQEASTLSVLSNRAATELSVGNIFGRDYWSADGTWSYEVDTSTREEDGPVFADAVSGHPLVKGWESQVSTLMERFGISKEIWDGPEWEEGRTKEDEVG